MTTRYGRTTPLQMDMLGLGGEIIELGRSDESDAARLEEMKLSRRNLCKALEVDFGYDLAAWHQFLLKSEEHVQEYKHPYAWSNVRKRILQLIDDPDRIRVAAIAAEQDRENECS